MQIWRMDSDGKNVKKITNSFNLNSWFPHVSPDGKKVAYLSFKSDSISPREHLPDKEIEIRLMDYDGKNNNTIAELHGGQGTLNTNSWSPDSKHIAFVRYVNAKEKIQG
jgi:Tol biopolymer transport system component